MAVNILARLRQTTEQLRDVQSILENQGDHSQSETLANIGKELDEILCLLVDVLADERRQSEINVTMNSDEIRTWLEQTFSSKQNQPKTTRNRFDSLKTIIQASSFVNALQRQIRQHNKERSEKNFFDFQLTMEDLSRWSFSMIQHQEPLIFTVSLIFDSHDLISRHRIDLETLANFTRALTDGYTKFRAPYHNDYHGADVLQTTHCFLLKTNSRHTFTQTEITALLFAAAVHDYEHPGLNNNYLVKTRNELALIYNDLSVLENHHSSSIFVLMQDSRFNIWSNMTSDEYRNFRSLVISLILATDMANHASLLERMSTYVLFKDSTTNTNDSKVLLQMILHAADISNASKPWPIYIKSTEKVLEEFFLQGDLEKVNCKDDKPTFDRDTTDMVQLQIGFIRHIVRPTFDILANFFQWEPSESYPWQLDLELNLETWQQISIHGDLDKLVVDKKPLTLNLDYLSSFIDQARTVLKRQGKRGFS